MWRQSLLASPETLRSNGARESGRVAKREGVTGRTRNSSVRPRSRMLFAPAQTTAIGVRPSSVKSADTSREVSPPCGEREGETSTRGHRSVRSSLVRWRFRFKRCGCRRQRLTRWTPPIPPVTNMSIPACRAMYLCVCSAVERRGRGGQLASSSSSSDGSASAPLFSPAVSRSHTHIVPATVVPPFLLSAMLGARSLLDTLQGPFPPELVLSATWTSISSVMPTHGTPSSTPIVAGTAPCERMMASSLSAVWMLSGEGRPWVTMAVSSATMGVEDASAEVISGEIRRAGWQKQSEEGLLRPEHTEKPYSDEINDSPSAERSARWRMAGGGRLSQAGGGGGA